MRTRPLLLGHRGARAVKTLTENTIASFDRALADGCDGFEFDVRLTSDRKPVICHDPKIAGREVARSTAHRLASLAQLDEVLARYQHSAFLDIELKIVGMEKVVVKLLKKYPPGRGFVVSSFLPEAVQAVHAIDSALPLGLICETKSQLRPWTRLPVEYVIAHHRLLAPAAIEQLKAAGKKILVWTVNHPSDMQKFADAGVDGIISDDSALLSRTSKPSLVVRR
jgi:glycerophosphoryl diester phosphodiesterase